ncbi:MAG: outer membrane beta-barrel protein [Candidatus Eisenbacteria bacterium]|uniref:Outer membrane beta-barrel protein n=1 Tax=Eiseniibacteriota bacterium TaxID=2212470 RepID=A0A956SFW1_UNCEI|nr:outer membrane beta-barrel protein [Candidatus Eisenbacteria bacterium]MCB9466572.1 outer membrane beta-barrel protein [Candidatus Eisenbacteria bacterium]
MRTRIIALVLLFSAVTAASSSAQGDLGLRGIGGQIGFTDMGLGNVFTFGGHADCGEFMPNLRLEPSFSYWRKSEFGLSFSLFRLNGDVKYLFPLESAVTPYAGGGLGYARGTVSIGGASASAAELQINLLGGIETQLTPKLRGFGELRIEDSTTHIEFGLTVPMGG